MSERKRGDSYENKYGPKTDGFRLLISNPTQIHEWVNNRILVSGEETNLDRAIIFNNFRDKLALEGKFDHPGEFISEIEIDDMLVRTLKFSVSANYSAKSGPWADLELSIGVQFSAFDLNWDFEISKNADNIGEHLKKKGISVTTEEDDEGLVSLLFPGNVSVPNFEGYLGYKSYKDYSRSSTYDPDYEIMRVDPSLYLSDQNLPFDKNEMYETLKIFQYVGSHFVDAIYKSVNLSPPNSTLEVKVDK